MSRFRRSYKTGTVSLSVDYGYDVHSIEFSGRTFRRIRAGKPVTIQGEGFSWEGEHDQDYWQFNRDRSGEEAPGSLYIHTRGGGEVYIGRLDDPEVVVDVRSFGTARWSQRLRDLAHGLRRPRE